MMAVISHLCDGLNGVAGWAPVSHEGILYVVLSTKITTCLMEASVDASATGMADVFKQYVQTAVVDVDLFKQIMLKTPFKVYKKSVKMTSSRWLKVNLDHYLIMNADWFRGLIAEVDLRCDVPEEISTDALEMCMNTKVHMFSDLSVRTQLAPGANVYENMGDGVELSHEQLQAMPAMNISWWTEAYQSGCVEYFNMYSNHEGVLGVVTSGRYVLPYVTINGSVRKSSSYRATLERVAQF